MKLSDATNAYLVLSQMAGLKMGAKASYGIAKNIRILEPTYQSFEDARKKIVAENFEDVDGTMTLLPENGSKADTEFQTLLALEVAVEPHMIKLADFGSAEPTPAQLLAIYWMIEE
jgi:hypothetical protein